MTDLVSRLSQGTHRVEVSLRPERSVEALQRRLAAGRVHLRFVDTRGGTELGVDLERDRCDLSGADFTKSEGNVVIAGSLVLDETPVRVIATISLPSLTGAGSLDIVTTS